MKNKKNIQPMVNRAYEIEKEIEAGTVSYDELAQYDSIIYRLHELGVISDEVMRDIESGEVGDIDMYIANSKS